MRNLAPAPGHKATNNMHLNRALQSSFADRVDNGDSAAMPYHCEICGRNFKHPGNYKQHMASHIRSTNSGLQAAATAALQMRNFPAATKVPEKSGIASTSSLSVNCRCGICDAVFTSAGEL